MSPRQVTNELGVVYQTVLHWVSRGKLTPVSRTVGGHARFARADVEAIKATRSKPGTPLPTNGEESPPAVETPGDASLAASGADHDVTKTVSKEIEKAVLAAAYGRRLIEHLDELRDEAVQRTPGAPRSEVFRLVWNASLAQVANRLDVEKHVLMRICKLYAIPTPPLGYWQTSIARRALRIARMQAASASDGN